MAMELTDYVYLDYAATAPLCEEALAALQPYLVTGRASIGLDANANSLHGPGRAAFKALEDARMTVARAIGARPDEISFTSCSTESDNAAVWGLALAADTHRHISAQGRKPRVVISAIEHHAVLYPAQMLERQGFELVVVLPTSTGHITEEALRKVMNEDTVLVSIQMANGEISTIQDMAMVVRVAKEFGAYVHTDATQSIGKMRIDLAKLGVNAASFSAHKVGGPKGVGVLYVKARTLFTPWMLGGGQESGRRSGTQNVAGAVACAASMKAAADMVDEEATRLRVLRDKLYVELCAIPAVKPTVDVPAGSEEFLPNVVNVCCEGFDSSSVVLQCNKLGFCVSGGSACSSGSTDPSDALTAIGVPRRRALGELRISMGRYTTAEDIDRFIEAFPKALEACRGR